MASLTQWTWVRASSGRWGRTGKLSVLQSLGSQRVGHDWVTEPPPPQAAEPESFSPGLCEVGVAVHCSTACLHYSFQQSFSPVICQDELGELWKIPFLSQENFVFEMNVAHSKYYRWINFTWGFPLWLSCKESVCNAGDVGLIPGSGRSLEKEMATRSSTLAWEIPWISGGSWLIGKYFDAGRDWGQEEKGTTEDEMAGWHHWLDGRESQRTPGVGDGQGGLACCDSWGRKESDTTERLIWSDLIWQSMGLQRVWHNLAIKQQQ